jgi:CspA family cold shock protein
MSTYSGTVKWFNSEKGYGFITGDEGQDVFVHYTSVKTNHKDSNLHEGQSVLYDVVEKDRGPMAINVERM